MDVWFAGKEHWEILAIINHQGLGAGAYRYLVHWNSTKMPIGMTRHEIAKKISKKDRFSINKIQDTTPTQYKIIWNDTWLLEIDFGVNSAMLNEYKQKNHLP